MREPPETRAVLSRLESVRADIEKTIDDSDSRAHWRSLVRGVLVYWLGEMFAEGEGHTKDMQTALDIVQTQIEQLKVVNAELQARCPRCETHDALVSARKQIENLQLTIQDLQDEVQILRNRNT